jgi:hypothetical protein
MIKLGLNIDHVATVRQARFTLSQFARAALICEQAGADAIRFILEKIAVIFRMLTWIYCAACYKRG